MSRVGTRPARIGILGCSDIASRRFIPALLATPRARLSGVASSSPERAARFAAGASCRAFDYRGLVDAPEIDLIYLSLPNHLHEEWTLAALEKGKHVICEKPLGLDPASVERMTAAAEERGLLLYENLTYLHHPLLARVSEALPEIGRIRTLRVVFGFTLRDSGNFRLDPARGGGAFHDLSRYPLSAALRFLDGEPESFTGVAFENNGLVTGMHGFALSSRQELFSFGIDFAQQYHSFYELVGERGRIRVDRAFTPPAEMAVPVQMVCGTEDRSFTVPATDQFRLMIEAVCGMIAADGDFRESHARNRRLAELAEQLRTGCTVVERD